MAATLYIRRKEAEPTQMNAVPLIKFIRLVTGKGLKDAKDLADEANDRQNRTVMIPIDQDYLNNSQSDAVQDLNSYSNILARLKDLGFDSQLTGWKFDEQTPHHDPEQELDALLFKTLNVAIQRKEQNIARQVSSILTEYLSR